MFISMYSIFETKTRNIFIECGLSVGQILTFMFQFSHQNWMTLAKFAKIRVGTSSEGSDITEIFPKFEKSQFPKLAKTKISEKNV